MSEPFRENMRYEYDLTPESRVMDVGGFDGDFAAEIHHRYKCEIVVFEPVPDFFHALCCRFQDGPDNIHLVERGVGGKDRKTTIGVKGNMSGEFTSDWNSTEPMVVEGINNVLSNYFPHGCDLIKLNCEGSEFEILEALVETPEIKTIRNIQVQWHAVFPEAQARYDQLQERLKKTHRLTWDYGWVWQNWTVL